MASSPPQAPHPRPSLVWPIVLVSIGVLFLLNNLGILAEDIWLPLLRLWPLVLILIGIEILVGPLWGGELAGMKGHRDTANRRHLYLADEVRLPHIANVNQGIVHCWLRR